MSEGDITREVTMAFNRRTNFNESVFFFFFCYSPISTDDVAISYR